MSDEEKRYAEVVNQVLVKFAGEQGARSVLFYTGEPDSRTFAEGLRKVFGLGAELMLTEISSRLDKQSVR